VAATVGSALGRRRLGGPTLATYAAVTFGWTWSFWAMLALAPDLPAPWSTLLFLTGGLGPLVGAASLVRHRTPAERRRFVRRVVDPRAVPAVWWWATAAVAAGPAIVGAVAAELVGATTSVPDRHLGAVMGVVGFALAAGSVEEPGWRGAARDARPPTVRPVWSGAGVGLLWAAWHLPLYAIDGSYQQGLGFGSVRFWLTNLVLVLLAVLYTWLVDGSGGSILLAVVAHAGFNAAGELVPRSVTGDVVATLVVIVLTVAVVAATRGYLRRRDHDDGSSNASP
jgi:uncharacterized protein